MRRPVYDVERAAGGFILRRDRKAFKTPAGIVLTVPAKALAASLAEEWRAQGEKPKPEIMPLTQLAATALDIVASTRDRLVKSVSAYAASDLLCHRADAPPELAERQAKIWQPWLDWAQEKYGVKLNVGQGVMPVVQPAESLAVLHGAVDAFDVFHLAGLQHATGVTGSLVLGLALAAEQATSDETFEAAELDSLFQMEKWGEDQVAVARHAGVRRDLEHCRTWFKLLRS